MEIITVYANKETEVDVESVACIGFFDGVHKGHQALLQETLKQAKEKGVLPACVTFHEDPWVVLNKDASIKNITPVYKRLELISAYGIERCYLLHFDKTMASLSKEDFVRLLKSLKIKTIVAGEDFRFARKHSGDNTYLAQHFDTIVCETVLVDGKKIASSNIEQAILKGDMQFVHDCLGYDYTITGIVICGRQVGRKLGFPTANLAIEDNYVIPKLGVYAGKVKTKGKIYKAMINVGHNPTLNYRNDISIEAHLLDFDQDIYNQEIEVQFMNYLRSEKKFETREALINQLAEDIDKVRSY